VIPILIRRHAMIEPVRIEPESIYDDGSLRQALGLTPAALAAARRTGTLRYTRSGKRILYRGSWILSWLDSPCTQKTAAGEAVTT
jgi:hypothetical protein